MLKLFLKYEYNFRKNESQLSMFIVYDIETDNADRAKPYNISFYRLGKLAAKYNRDLPPNELDRCRKGTYVFVGKTCISNALENVSKLKDNGKLVKLFWSKT